MVLSSFFVCPLHAALLKCVIFIIFPRLSALPSGQGVLTGCRYAWMTATLQPRWQHIDAASSEARTPISWLPFWGCSTRKMQSCPENISIYIGGRLHSNVCMARCGLPAAIVWLYRSKTIEDHVLYHATVISRCTRQ